MLLLLRFTSTFFSCHYDYSQSLGAAAGPQDHSATDRTWLDCRAPESSQLPGILRTKPCVRCAGRVLPAKAF